MCSPSAMVVRIILNVRSVAVQEGKSHGDSANELFTSGTFSAKI